MTVCMLQTGTGNHRCASRETEAGFTLLEIMVAMVVLTMIITTAFGALRLGERSWETGLTLAGNTETLRTVAGLMQRQFNQVLPLSWTEDTQTSIAFYGDYDRVRFIAPAPQHHGATGLFEFTLIVEPHASGASLVLYYRLHDPDSRPFQPDDSESQRVLLLDNLKSAAFNYYGSPAVGDPPRWHSQWGSDAETFPQLVRARLATSSEQQQWPELFFSLNPSMAQ